MAKDFGSTLASWGETRLIENIRRWLGAACPPSPRGIGDDCAVLPSGRGSRELVTVDPLIQGLHFDDALPASAVAAKLLRRNLSDVAAMGGTPRHALVALAAPSDLRTAWLAEFFRALGREARRFGVQIVGGDCVQTNGMLGIWLTLLGDAPARPLTRCGARVGDLLFVTGTLGGSILGHHFRFQPRLAEGRWLAQHESVHAAIDLSDGLGKDLLALIPAGATALIDPRHIPLSSAARRRARETGCHPLACALNDGEDYELLFAVAANRAERLSVDWRRRFSVSLSCIGRLMRRKAGEPSVGFSPVLPADVRPLGYEHFR